MVTSVDIGCSAVRFCINRSWPPCSTGRFTGAVRLDGMTATSYEKNSDPDETEVPDVREILVDFAIPATILQMTAESLTHVLLCMLVTNSRTVLL